MTSIVSPQVAYHIAVELFGSNLFFNFFCELILNMSCVACGENQEQCCMRNHARVCNTSDAVCTTADSSTGPGGATVKKNTCLDTWGGNGQYCSTEDQKGCKTDNNVDGNSCSSTHVCECTIDKLGHKCADGKVCDPGGAAPTGMPTPPPGSTIKPPPPGSTTKPPASNVCPSVKSKALDDCRAQAGMYGVCWDPTKPDVNASCLTQAKYDGPPPYTCPPDQPKKCILGPQRA